MQNDICSFLLKIIRDSDVITAIGRRGPRVDVISSRKIGWDAIVKGTSSKRRLISGKINNNLWTEQLFLRDACPRENSLFPRLSPPNEVPTQLYYKTNIFQVLWGITIVLWKSLPARTARRNGPRGETSIFDDHNDTDWYIISYNFYSRGFVCSAAGRKGRKRGGSRHKREGKKEKI